MSNRQANWERLSHIAGEAGDRAPVSLRVNPDVDAKTHPLHFHRPQGTKFGVAYTDVVNDNCHAREPPHLGVAGVDCHIGSQMTEVTPFADALESVLR